MYVWEGNVRKRPEALVIRIPAGEAARWSQACVNFPEVITLLFLVVHKSWGTFRMKQHSNVCRSSIFFNLKYSSYVSVCLKVDQ